MIPDEDVADMFLKIHYLLSVVEVMFVFSVQLLVLILMHCGTDHTCGGGLGRKKYNVGKDNLDAHDKDGVQMNQNWI